MEEDVVAMMGDMRPVSTTPRAVLPDCRDLASIFIISTCTTPSREGRGDSRLSPHFPISDLSVPLRNAHLRLHSHSPPHSLPPFSLYTLSFFIFVPIVVRGRRSIIEGIKSMVGTVNEVRRQ